MGAELPEWLPEPWDYGESDGDPIAFDVDAYAVFKEDFIDQTCYFRCDPVVLDRTMSNGREETYWHITSEDRDNQREADLRRMERIEWPRLIIEHCYDGQVSIWENTRGKQSRVLLWCESANYIVVLTKKKTVYVLTAAYPTDHEHTRKKLRKEREEFNKQTPP